MGTKEKLLKSFIEDRETYKSDTCPIYLNTDEMDIIIEALTDKVYDFDDETIFGLLDTFLIVMNDEDINDEDRINTHLHYKNVLCKMVQTYASKQSDAVEFAEWLSENQWHKRIKTHPNRVGQYYSDLHCEYKTIKELYNQFLKEKEGK